MEKVETKYGFSEYKKIFSLLLSCKMQGIFIVEGSYASICATCLFSVLSFLFRFSMAKGGCNFKNSTEQIILGSCMEEGK